MMDKEKIIEELAKDIFDCNDALNGIDFAFGYGKKDSHFGRIAKKLTAIGYRKIPEGAVVLTKEEYEEVPKTYERRRNSTSESVSKREQGSGEVYITSRKVIFGSTNKNGKTIIKAEYGSLRYPSKLR